MTVQTDTQSWSVYHGDPCHTGFVASGSGLDSAVVADPKRFSPLHTLDLDGPVLSVPAVVDGKIYVGIANSHLATGSNGGTFYRIAVESGVIEKSYTWDLGEGPDGKPRRGDSHGFTGMGCTPAVDDARVYFSAFDGRAWCLDRETLEPVWVTDMRFADPAQNQPVTNDFGGDDPAAAGWSSPVIAGDNVYFGAGEGENPALYAFVFCLEKATGRVRWIFCTNQFEEGTDNRPNVLPAEVVKGEPPAGFSVHDAPVVTKGCSPWSSIAYDEGLQRLYVGTGNGAPDDDLPTKGYSNGLLSLCAVTGEFRGFYQAPPESNYRPSDDDIDFGASPTIFTIGADAGTPRRVVGIGGKNGTFFILDAATLALVRKRQLLPYYNDGTRIPTVDPHYKDADVRNPQVSNAESDATQGENFHGIFSCAAIHPASRKLFVGLGGNNYNLVAPGIDHSTTPFMRAIDWETMADAWPLDDHDPKRYLKARPPMYENAGESGLSSPAVVNDVVFCTTSRVAIYAFKVEDGTLLFEDQLGEQTQGLNGGYGYCLGPAVWQDYVVAGGLVNGRKGGVLKIYGPPRSD